MESQHYNEFAYVDNPFRKYAYKGNHLTKSVVEVDSCRARKVLSRYSQKIEECKVEHPERVVSPYFQKVEECNVEHPQRVVSRSTKSIEDLEQFRYQSEKVSSQCVKKSELPPKIFNGSRKRPKVEKPRKSKRKTKPFLKADRCREAYIRKTPDNNWVPPRSTPPLVEKRLLQEYHFRDPWRVIVICMLLNRTKGEQVHLSKYFFSC
jgi:methyl-CpG-binding domain protein 4